MKVAIVTEVFLPKVDGVVTRLTHTIEQLVGLGHEVQIFAPGNPPATFAGCRVVALPSLEFPPYPEIQFGLPNLRLFREIKAFGPDVIHAVNPLWTAALGVFAAKRYRRPLIASFHTNVPEYVEALGIGWTRPLVEGATKWLHNQAAVNLSTSAPMVDKARAMGLRNVQLWPKAVDTQAYRPDRATNAMRRRLTGGNPEAPLVAYIGRVSKEKNLEILPELIQQLRSRVPGARLAVVGAGPYLDELKAACGNDAVFTGYLAGAELAAAFAVTDVFAFPSATETLGLVALEAFASGTPVVGTNAGGIPFVIDEGETGHLMDPHATAADWAGVIAGLLEDPERRARMGAYARREAERYSWRESTQALVGYYEEAVGASGAGSKA